MTLFKRLIKVLVSPSQLLLVVHPIASYSQRLLFDSIPGVSKRIPYRSGGPGDNVLEPGLTSSPQTEAHVPAKAPTDHGNDTIFEVPDSPPPLFAQRVDKLDNKFLNKVQNRIPIGIVRRFRACHLGMVKHRRVPTAGAIHSDDTAWPAVLLANPGQSGYQVERLL